VDHYVEQIVKKKPSFKQRMMIVGTVFLLLLGIPMFLFIHVTLGFTIIAVGAVLIGFAKNAQFVEYEYLFINGDCDIAKITNKASRKKMYGFPSDDVKRVLPYNSDKFQNELQVNSNVSTKLFTSGLDENRDSWYAFMVDGNGKKANIVLELNEKSLDHVKSFYKKQIEL